MSLSEHRYHARIAPVSSTATDAIHAGAIIVDESGQRITESFAPGGLTWPTKPCPVLIDHDERFPVGFVSDVAERDGWHQATFVLNMDKPLADVACELLRVGTPVSLGAKSIQKDESVADLGLAIQVKRHTVAFLEEVSILSPGVVPAYRGAKVIRITERGTALDRMRERERERPEAKSKPPKPATTTTRTITRSRDHKGEAEEAELRRRVEWAERHQGHADFEQILTHLRVELGYEMPLLRRARGVAA